LPLFPQISQIYTDYFDYDYDHDNDNELKTTCPTWPTCECGGSPFSLQSWFSASNLTPHTSHRVRVRVRVRKI